MDSDSSQKPKRRVRYKGTHPRNFKEKYKELNIAKYESDIAKVIERGATPAGTHRPICVTEILEFLNPQPGQLVVDATLGYGGHAQVLLEKILPSGKLIAFDQDPIERPKTELRLRSFLSDKEASESSLIVAPLNFSEAWSFFKKKSIPRVDMILADLGLSSMQIDTPERGFSFKTDAPFDLRMNPEVGVTAADFLATLSEPKLTQILAENADEPHARQIAAALVKHKPRTTFQVAKVVRDVVKTFSKNIQEKEKDTPIRRVFQALRIEVNSEFTALDKFLSEIPNYLKPGGRVAILSFHSGEDRRVKKFFKEGERAGVFSAIAPDIIRPSIDEQRSNPRSKSAKLRWAIRA